MQVWRSEDDVKEWILSFYPVGPGDRIQFVRLDSKYLLAEPSFWLSFLNIHYIFVICSHFIAYNVCIFRFSVFCPIPRSGEFFSTPL